MQTEYPKFQGQNGSGAHAAWHGTAAAAKFRQFHQHYLDLIAVCTLFCRDKLQKEDLHRFELQYSYIRQICALYEDDPSNFGKLFSLIQEVSLPRHLSDQSWPVEMSNPTETFLLGV